MRSIILSILILTVSSFSYAGTDKSSNYSIYVAGLLYHFDTAPENNDGNMEYLALSRDFQKGNWLFETGAGTYLDSYYKRSYLIFSNITHNRFKKKMG